jgi:hypothetical protein
MKDGATARPSQAIMATSVGRSIPFHAVPSALLSPRGRLGLPGGGLAAVARQAGQ